MSKIIKVTRRPNHTNLPNEIYDSAKKRIGSTYGKNGDVNTGITVKETETLMPHVLGISTGDPAFFKKVKEWFMNLSVDIPAQGIELEAGVDKDGNPLNVNDYIRYKFISQHPYVYKRESSNPDPKNKRYMYILEDKEREQKEKIKKKDSRKGALAEWIKLTANEKKMVQVLRVYGEFPDNMDKETMEMTLENLAMEDSAKFVRIATNKDLEMKAFIQECLSAEVLRKVGNSYLDGEEVLGSNMEETLLFLADKKNSETLVTLKARLKQFK